MSLNSFKGWPGLRGPHPLFKASSNTVLKSFVKEAQRVWLALPPFLSQASTFEVSKVVSYKPVSGAPPRPDRLHRDSLSRVAVHGVVAPDLVPKPVGCPATACPDPPQAARLSDRGRGRGRGGAVAWGGEVFPPPRGAIWPNPGSVECLCSFAWGAGIAG